MSSIKQVLLVGLLLFVISGCKMVAYFHTSNDMFGQDGTVYLEDGTEKNGEITIFFETDHEPKNFIELKSNGNSEKIFIKEIKGYKIKDKYYVPRLVDLNGNGINHLLFVQRLTKEKSKIHLYELYQRNQGNNAYGEDIYSYYISLPTLAKYEVWNASSKYLVPRFEEKMSKIVSDCPSLANKIQQENNGYFYGQATLSNQKKLKCLKELSMNIINVNRQIYNLLRSPIIP